tara:strand:+ start:814 stop:1026 length:213 start_codon:yes stop_codon:yes gene_type:complete
MLNFIKRLLRLIQLRRFNFFVNKKSTKLSTEQIDELIEANKDALINLGDNADYDGMGDWGRFPPIKKKNK